MSYKDDFESKRSIIAAIPDDQIWAPNMPMEVYHKEAELLEKVATRDQAQLTPVGLDGAFIRDLPARIGASREAQANWDFKRFQRKEAMEAWVTKSPAAYDLRNQVVHAMFYAYRNNPNLLGRVQKVAEGDGDADMLQDLNVLDVIARENPAPLEAIGFDMALVRSLSEVGRAMADLRASATVDSTEIKLAKKLRDQAYTHLKVAMDEIRATGRYVFWRDAQKSKDYASEYLRTNRKKAPTEVPVEN